ncbi:hypothetical protein CKO51_27200 [Rhodopirellula sp. SM50]|nr:BREX-2 system phosphatase PglZ [Rhodopirellula sp. SM50]PAY16343.1 hypothetical protein CKO51_27200 [Rhodopirellula sp. SM50]
MNDLTFNQLKAQVAAVRKKIPESTAIAIRSHHRWTGEPERRDGDDVYLIHQCDSPLAMRVALRQQSEPDGNGARPTSILITDLDDEQIGDDILVRLKPRKVVPLDNWQIVKSLFQAREIDPRVTGHHWIAAELMNYGAMRDCPPATSGFLDAESVWRILLVQLIGFEGETPDLLGLLKWSTSAENVGRWRALDTPIRDCVREWMTGLAGPAAEAVLRACLENERPDALPIGLAAGVVLHPRAKGKLEKASGKLEERYLSGETPKEPVVAAWHAAASDVVRLGISDGRLKQQLLARGDEILQELGGDSHAWLSDTSPVGFDQRLARFGDRLGTVLNELKNGPADLESLAKTHDLLQTHDRATRERRRMDRVQMAMRLVRWLCDRERDTASHSARSLAEAAGMYLREGGYVDWARLTLRSGDPVRELSQGYSKLFDQGTSLAESRSQHFAKLLKDWTASHVTDDLLVPVEQILDRIVSPIAKKTPVLVIVIDGLSVAVFRELMDDVLGSDWALLAEEEVGLRSGLATIPSVTEASRTSLLCGKLAQGGSANEKTGFAEHSGLVAASRSTHPPVLFHKASLQESEDASLAADIRKEIGSSHRKVVGVVVNAVDDHLLKGEQIDTRWTRDEIKVLPALLHEAKMSRRTVIVLSDHGHILDCNAKGKKADGGERWRFDEDDPAEGELQIAGPRVVIPESKKLIAPWSEKLRYGIKKNGYHGGLTPQEMVVPIAVLSTSDSFPAGWQEATVDLPAWWNEPLPIDSDIEREVPVIKPQPKKAPETLFDFAEAIEASEPKKATDPSGKESSDKSETAAVWIQALLASPIFEQQKTLGGRAIPRDEVFAKMLGTIDARGGKMTSPALASAIGFSSMRLRGLLAIAGRVLNIDGYAVLTHDEASDTITLDRTLLCKQFDLTEK